jgi:hypothetical protein
LNNAALFQVAAEKPRNINGTTTEPAENVDTLHLDALDGQELEGIDGAHVGGSISIDFEREPAGLRSLEVLRGAGGPLALLQDCKLSFTSNPGLNGVFSILSFLSS